MNGSEKVKFIQKIVSYAWEKNNSSCVILINFHSLLKVHRKLSLVSMGNGNGDWFYRHNKYT